MYLINIQDHHDHIIVADTYLGVTLQGTTRCTVDVNHTTITVARQIDTNVNLDLGKFLVQAFLQHDTSTANPALSFVVIYLLQRLLFGLTILDVFL